MSRRKVYKNRKQKTFYMAAALSSFLSQSLMYQMNVCLLKRPRIFDYDDEKGSMVW